MKKIIVILIGILVFCSGCSGNQNRENQMEESQSEIKQVEETESLNDQANTSVNNIDYGTTANEFIESAQVHGMVIDLTDTGFMTGAAFASGSPDDNITTNVVYDIETVQIKTASVKADGSSFSVIAGQLSDLVEKAYVQVYGDAQDDGTFKAAEIIIVTYDYS